MVLLSNVVEMAVGNRLSTREHVVGNVNTHADKYVRTVRTAVRVRDRGVCVAATVRPPSVVPRNSPVRPTTGKPSRHTWRHCVRGIAQHLTIIVCCASRQVARHRTKTVAAPPPPPPTIAPPTARPTEAAPAFAAVRRDPFRRIKIDKIF